MVDGAPLREVAGQHPPLAAAFQQVQDGAEHVVQIHRARTGLLASLFQQLLDWFELLTTYVTGVYFSHPFIVNAHR